MRRTFLVLFCLAALAVAKKPRPLADITLAAPAGGKAINLSSYKGKVMLIAVFSTECGECVNAIQFLNRLQAEYKGKAVVLTGGAANPGAAANLRPFIDRYNLSLPLGALNEPEARRLTDSGPTDRLMVPAFLFVDKKGTVRYQYPADSEFFKSRDNNTRGLLNELLGQ
jgi:peroxiredoxin